MTAINFGNGASLSSLQFYRAVFPALQCAALTLVASTSVFAQQIEENPAPIVTGTERAGLPNPALDSSEDDTPFGVQLVNIVVTQKGAAYSNAELEAELSGFIDKPLSNKLIADIRAAVTSYFRSINRPLVAVDVPPQEVSAGVLRLDVLPFTVAEKKTEGNSWTPDSHVQKNVRLNVGDEVESAELIEDLNWLNLNPYRNLGVVFEPGDKPGTTNVILRSNEKKPWTVWSGYHNYGSDPSDQDRVFAGFNIANLPIIDHQLSYQVTTSPDLVGSGRLFNLGNELGYLSHSLSTFAPVTFGNGNRHKFSTQVSYVQSYSNLTTPFTQSTETVQIYGEHAFAPIEVADFLPEVYSGIDYKRQNNEVFFNNTSTTATEMDIVQLVMGVRGTLQTPFGIAPDTGRSGRANFDLRLVGSPGSLSSRNSDAAFALASGNRSVSSSYIYLYGTFKHAMPLPAEMSFNNSIGFQLADRPLPSLEQFSLGGENTVRGYYSNEVGGDNGIALQNTLFFPLTTTGDAIELQLQPFLFADIGWAKDLSSRATDELASVGGGINVSFGSNLNASLNVSHILMDGTKSSKGDNRLFARVTARY